MAVRRCGGHQAGPQVTRRHVHGIGRNSESGNRSGWRQQHRPWRPGVGCPPRGPAQGTRAEQSPACVHVGARTLTARTLLETGRPVRGSGMCRSGLPDFRIFDGSHRRPTTESRCGPPVRASRFRDGGDLPVQHATRDVRRAASQRPGCRHRSPPQGSSQAALAGELGNLIRRIPSHSAERSIPCQPGAGNSSGVPDLAPSHQRSGGFDLGFVGDDGRIRLPGAEAAGGR